MIEFRDLVIVKAPRTEIGKELGIVNMGDYLSLAVGLKEEFPACRLKHCCIGWMMET